MRVTTWSQAMNVRTLRDAHEAVRRLRPAPEAPLREWRDFYARSAAVYTQVADVDRAHHHEALYWVNRDTDRAAEFAQRLAASQSS
ncbi:AMED_5909 family protein [Allokutzneria sp. NRRL B-24872]|uniref:AMED_5909 family protein n=1 Tax=Allokutzneria sp. NRRL B-24872 TaxID=1137961 RepID=UPI001FEF9AC7|nr:AMED_5909 family protein [Allokutzneria sp. NRRL B-24872]